MEKIRLGFFGAGTRGRHLAKTFMELDCEIVALCDNRAEELEKTANAVGGNVATYSDFSDFIEHEMDAVVLANFFHEHAPYAIRCFEKGLHVFSECISNGTMAEGVELIRAFEKSNSVYMLAENYPQMLFNREMKRVCDSGTLGKLLYAEGEYNHPSDPWDTSFNKDYVNTTKHWRNYVPITYYITHSLGPVMWMTGAMPNQVSALPCYAPKDPEAPTASFCGDRAAIITTKNDDGSVFRIPGCAAFGGHHNAYRVCGTKGQIENLRGMGNQVMLRYNSWEKPDGVESKSLYTPEWNDADEEIIARSGHGGGDYLTARNFINCIKENKQPEHPFNVYSAVAMSSVAILGYRSMLEDGTPYRIPDFTKEEDCAKYENDRLTPFYGSDGSEPTLGCCSNPDYRPSEKQIELFLQTLK